MTNRDYRALARKLTGIDDKAPMPPQTGTDRRVVHHMYAIIGFSLAMVLFGVIVAFMGYF